MSVWRSSAANKTINNFIETMATTDHKIGKNWKMKFDSRTRSTFMTRRERNCRPNRRWMKSQYHVTSPCIRTQHEPYYFDMRRTEVLDKAHTKIDSRRPRRRRRRCRNFHVMSARTRKMIFIDTKITWMTKANTRRRQTEPTNVHKNERIKGNARGPAHRSSNRCQNYSMKPLIPHTHNAKCSRIEAPTSPLSKQQKQKDPNNGAAALLWMRIK